MNELPELTQVPAWLAEQIKFARDWWHDDPVCLLPGEEGAHTVFVIEFYDGCKYFGYTRKSVVARVASLMSESGGWGSNAFVRDHGFVDPVIWTYGGSVLDGWHRYTIANLLKIELEVREYDGDPVQWVIGRNLHRRHLTAVQRSSCVSACIDWAKQGQQQVMHTDRDDSGQFSPIGDKLAPIGQPDSTALTQADSGQESARYHEAAEESFFTQDERASLADVSERTQKRSDAYEKAGLGPEVRSGAISGAEAERIVQDPDTPRPPSLIP